MYYTPNSSHLGFLKNLLSFLHSEIEVTLILAGDTNLALDNTLDKSSSTIYKHPFKISYKLVDLLFSNDLIDAWREANPMARDYSFYSSAHNKYSLIDHIFIQSHLIPKLLSAKYIPDPWSDYEPLLTSFSDLTIQTK